MNFFLDNRLKSIFKISKISLLFLVIVIFSSPCAFQASYASSAEIDDWVDYKVLEANNGTNYFYGAWPPGDYYGNWSVAKGEHIGYNITSSDVTGINGTLTLGNYTFNNVRNIDAASALALSIYPWNGGFFANSSDWLAIEIQIENTNTSIKEESNIKYTINNIDLFFEVIKFNTIDYYGQNSLFCYDKNSGVLLSAKSYFGNYLLNISLSFTSIEIGFSSKTFTLKNPYIFSYVLIFLAIMVLKRKSRKKST